MSEPVPTYVGEMHGLQIQTKIGVLEFTTMRGSGTILIDSNAPLPQAVDARILADAINTLSGAACNAFVENIGELKSEFKNAGMKMETHDDAVHFIYGGKTIFVTPLGTLIRDLLQAK